MIYKLELKDYKKINKLVSPFRFNPIIQGVIEGNQRGEIYTDYLESPNTALVWAKNEMYYLIGDSSNLIFNEEILSYLKSTIFPEAINIGEDTLNLETYPHESWKKVIESQFDMLKTGERIPFEFQKELFLQSSFGKRKLSKEYEIKRINKQLIESDDRHTVLNEILKFWKSIDLFLEHGIGYCATYKEKVIGTCISVFVSQDIYEIGINTYDKSHRGKGIATKNGE
ncbi:GNAT family N-acetyltransferase [Litchfieldia alkalitelluris]|uniref:GNAT family N-acetyltransferase n=1 Tax=Litchfieldia alkalitelluris TaxID=304268 RepID=UPI0009973583|nr:GNAT family N-acetyltransferase [Litchfieldia alkalitelluris]